MVCDWWISIRSVCFCVSRSSKVGSSLFCFVASFINRVKTKKPTLLEGGCVEICLNEVMSPSPGELLFDASAQSPPGDKTVEMLHFY